jgi:hypothetical protein
MATSTRIPKLSDRSCRKITDIKSHSKDQLCTAKIVPISLEEDHQKALEYLRDQLKSLKNISKIISKIEKYVSSRDHSLIPLSARSSSSVSSMASLKRTAVDFIQCFKQFSTTMIPTKKSENDEQTFNLDLFLQTLISIRIASMKKQQSIIKTESLILSPTNHRVNVLEESLQGIQRTLNQLSYNHVGSIQLFTIKKSLPFYLLIRTAKDILKHRLPIKCLEAVVVSM